MIKLIYPKRVNKIDLYAISAKKSYTEIVNDSIKSIHIKFKIMKYGLIISGWHLISLILLFALISNGIISLTIGDIMNLGTIKFILINSLLGVSMILLLKIIFDVVSLIKEVKIARR